MPRGSKRPPNAGKGRPKGVPNKNTTAIKDMLRQALDGAGGVEYLIEQARENPGPFLSLVGKLIPHEVNATIAGKVTLSELVERAVATDKP